MTERSALLCTGTCVCVCECVRVDDDGYESPGDVGERKGT